MSSNAIDVTLALIAFYIAVPQPYRLLGGATGLCVYEACGGVSTALKACGVLSGGSCHKCVFGPHAWYIPPHRSPLP